MSNGRRAPSVATWFSDNGKGDIILQELMVPSSHLTRYTYYCCLQWNAGMNGGGYCGIQDHPNGKNYIFSVWDPEPNSMTPGKHIEAVFVGNGTKIERFGGEGEGLKSWNFTLGWETDRWYNMVVRRWDFEGHTRFGFWVHDGTEKRWHHLVTMDFPVLNVYFCTKTCCFVEDWHGSGEKLRGAMFRNGFKRLTDGSWLPFGDGNFHVNQEPACKKYNNNFCAETNEDLTGIFMQTGHPVIPSEGQGTSCKLKVQVTHKEPFIPPIEFEVTSIMNTGVKWYVPESSTPQFSYTVKVNDHLIESGIDPYKREVLLHCTSGQIEVSLHDIIGREKTICVNV
ncbi:hypothetical protein CHS0354_036933 [Potamilus streckersoni]|uniref:DUF3472 domain-containing protein n=1 Tax=Potamilus streckersoni TaxID=2493646 RepID=A0AAE0VZG0_9BIVA|nr:hypothetical protein CHS0354_036933 [Potamilus streckersoni]